MDRLPSPASNPLRRYLHGKGKAPYALVTGATGGMGLEWAAQLASHGFNVILQGRNRTKLEEVRQTILSRQRGVKRKSSSKRLKADGSAASTATDSDVGSGKRGASVRRKGSVKKRKSSDSLADADAHKKSTKAMNDTPTDATALPVPSHVEVEVLVCEATPWPNKGLNEGLDEFLNRKDIRLTVVINNLGVQSEGYPRLEDLSRDELSGIVVANSLFPAEVTRRTLPHLKQHQPSLLVTVTSIGAWTPTPYLSPYMGTKGFDVAFSHSLRSEMMCEEQQVDVVCMVPGQVQSGMCLEPESLMVPTSFDWVRAAIVSLRPGGTLGAIFPYSWFAPPPLSSSAKARTSVSTSYWTRPKGVITPWWPHYLGMVVAQYGPMWLVDSVAVKTVQGLKRKHDEVDADDR